MVLEYMLLSLCKFAHGDNFAGFFDKTYFMK